MGQIASTSQLRMSFLRWALVTVPLVILLGIASGQVAGSGSSNIWFESLTKPDFMPPEWAFGVAWTIFYALIGLALAFVMAARGARGRQLALTLFSIQFVLNLAWSPVFFAAHQVTAALVIIILMFVFAAITTMRFAKIRMVAALLMLPYLAWLIFAAALNYEVRRLNPNAETLVPGAAATQISL